MALPLYHQVGPLDSIDLIVMTYSPLSLPIAQGRGLLASVNPGLSASREGDWVRIPDPWRDQLGDLYESPEPINTTTKTSSDDEDDEKKKCDPPSRLLWFALGGAAGVATAYVVGGVVFWALEDRITDELIAARRARSR